MTAEVAPGEVLLECTDLVRRFGGVAAVDGVGFGLRAGEVSALIGPNGAGKTTVFNLLSGFLAVTSGSITWRGRDITSAKATARAGSGLVRTFQQPRVFAALTVHQNLVTATHAVVPSRVSADLLGLPGARRRARQRQGFADELLDRFDLAVHAEVKAGDLPYGLRKRLGLVLGVAASPRVLLMDEPAAGLNDAEVELLKQDLATIRGSGVTICIVEHHMGLIMSVSDRVMVMESGRMIADGTPAEIANDERVVSAYLGQGATA